MSDESDGHLFNNEGGPLPGAPEDEMSDVHPAAVRAANQLHDVCDDLNDIDAARTIHFAIDDHLREIGLTELVALAMMACSYLGTAAPHTLHPGVVLKLQEDLRQALAKVNRGESDG